MARRKRFAEAWEIPPAEERAAAIAREPDEAPDRDEEEAATVSPQQAALRLEHGISNHAVARALVQRSAMPGAPEVGMPRGEGLPEVPGVDAAQAPPMPGRDELAGRRPEQQVDAFQRVREILPPQAQEVLTQAAEAARKAAGGTPRAQYLKAQARSRLGNVPPGEVRDPIALLERLCDAIAVAWAMWQQQMTLAGAIVNGPSAVGGDVLAPPIGPMFTAAAAPQSAAEAQAVGVLGSALDTSLTVWKQTAKIPGIPLFPTFAAFPGPIAPPTQAIPFPLTALVGNRDALRTLEASMTVLDPAVQAVLKAIAGALGDYFPLWLGSTMVTNMLGFGPVPTFAPPYVLAGPVIGGTAIALPGSIAGGL